MSSNYESTGQMSGGHTANLAMPAENPSAAYTYKYFHDLQESYCWAPLYFSRWQGRRSLKCESPKENFFCKYQTRVRVYFDFRTLKKLK